MNLEKDWNNEAQVCGISYAQQHCLWLLHVQDGLTLTQLSNIAIWNKSTTSALVSRLEKKGLIRKEREERAHDIRIFLTEEGFKKIEESTNSKECLGYMSLFKDYDEEKIEEILKVFRYMYEQVSKNRNPDFDIFIDDFSKNLLG